MKMQSIREERLGPDLADLAFLVASSFYHLLASSARRSEHFSHLLS